MQAEKLIEKMNGWNSVPDNEFQLYEALVLGNAGLATPF
jgi:hypothetical protein